MAEPFKSTTPELIAAGETALWKLFEANTGEVLVVRGAQSDLLTRETLDEMIQRGQQVSTVEIPDVGHAPTFIQPDQVAIARKFFLGQ
jgi:pimeloyl-ACP methyl ester carboxylesterase